MTSSASRATLPNEHLSRIVGYFDSARDNDRAGPLSLSRVCSILYDLAISALYHSVYLNDETITRLLASSHHQCKGDEKEYKEFLDVEESVDTRDRFLAR